MARYGSGSVYRPSSRDFDLALEEVKAADAVRLQAIWTYWEQEARDNIIRAPVLSHPAPPHRTKQYPTAYTEDDAASEAEEALEDELHPDHRAVSGGHRA